MNIPKHLEDLSYEQVIIHTESKNRARSKEWKVAENKLQLEKRKTVLSCKAGVGEVAWG